jgi:hypothetical protein
MSTLWSAKVSTIQKGNARGLLEANEERLCARITTLKFKNGRIDQSSSSAADRSPGARHGFFPQIDSQKRTPTLVLLLSSVPIGQVGSGPCWRFLRPHCSANYTAQMAIENIFLIYHIHNLSISCLGLSCTNLLSLTAHSGLNSVSLRFAKRKVTFCPP